MRRWVVWAGWTVGCTGSTSSASLPAVPTAPDVTPVVAAPWTAPDPATIPEGPLGDAIRDGRAIAMETYERLPEAVSNRLHCSSCHLGGGTVPNAGPWVGITGVFPEYRPRNAKVNVLEDRINDCFERSMNGHRLDADDPAMVSLVAYMTWLSQGQPVGVSVAGRGFPKLADQPAPDADRGAAVYAAKCVACHGQDGQGTSGPNGAYAFPPLWGPEAFNLGAGMARLDTATAFISQNMPLGQGGTLTPAEAVDVAAYVTRQPRPDFAGKHLDWPKGGKPRDARY